MCIPTAARFATSIIAAWRKLDLYYRSLHASAIDESSISNDGDEIFPVERPKFILVHEWEFLERMVLSTSVSRSHWEIGRVGRASCGERLGSVVKQIRTQVPLEVEDVIVPKADLSIRECLDLCKAYAYDNELGQLYKRVADVLEQLKAIVTARSDQLPKMVEAVSIYCWCLDRLFSLLREGVAVVASQGHHLLQDNKHLSTILVKFTRDWIACSILMLRCGEMRYMTGVGMHYLNLNKL